jgi:cysteine desulfurase
MTTPTYMDYSATTPVDERVAAIMMKYLTMDGDFGNPASNSHYYGWQADEAVKKARKQVADLISADPREIVFTSGATVSLFTCIIETNIVSLRMASFNTCKSNRPFGIGSK